MLNISYKSKTVTLKLKWVHIMNRNAQRNIWIYLTERLTAMNCNAEWPLSLALLYTHTHTHEDMHVIERSKKNELLHKLKVTNTLSNFPIGVEAMWVKKESSEIFCKSSLWIPNFLQSGLLLPISFTNIWFIIPNILFLASGDEVKIVVEP